MISYSHKASLTIRPRPECSKWRFHPVAAPLVFKDPFYNQIKGLPRHPHHKPLKYCSNLLDGCQFFSARRWRLSISRSPEDSIARFCDCKRVWRFQATPEDNMGCWEGVQVFPASPVSAIYAAFCTTARPVQAAALLTRRTPLARQPQKCTHIVLHAPVTAAPESILDITKGFPSWMQQGLCYSPKINNGPSYTTHLPTVLWM